MTIMVAEAAPEAAAAAETTAADAGQAVTRRRPVPARRPPRTIQGRAEPRHARATPLPAAAQRDRQANTPPRAAGDRPARQRPARDRRRPSVPSFGGKGRAGGYHGTIKAEFLAAVLIIVVAPFFTPGPSSSKGGTGPSPYGRSDLTRLAAVFAVFFILSLISKGRPGKLAAMFGALVVLGVLFQAHKSGAISGVAKVFTKGAATGSAATSSPGVGAQTQSPGVGAL